MLRSGVKVHFAKTNSGDPVAFTRIVAVPFALAYFAATCYFLRAGTSVLQSLTDKRSRIVSAYLLASSVFMVMHLSAAARYASEVVFAVTDKARFSPRTSSRSSSSCGVRLATWSRRARVPGLG